MKSGVYVRAKTSDDRWATIDAIDLSDKSFRLFVLQKLSEAGIVAQLSGDAEGWVGNLETPLTKVETEYQ